MLKVTHISNPTFEPNQIICYIKHISENYALNNLFEILFLFQIICNCRENPFISIHLGNLFCKPICAVLNLILHFVPCIKSKI